jgi:phosphatidylglycerophosphatase A
MSLTSRASLPPGVEPGAPSTVIATWFSAGLIRPAPGTWGSMAALPIGFILAAAGGPLAVLAGAVVVFVAGLWASDRMIRSLEGTSETPDQPCIVVDEVSGQLLALSTAGTSPSLLILGFVFFRLFDIVKPWPISAVERRVPGAWGVMLDDTVAGAFAAVLVLAAAVLIQVYVV